MQPHPVPMSATTPRIPHPASRIPVSRRTSSTSPSVSGRGISTRGSRLSSSERKSARPTAYPNGIPFARRSTARRKRRATSAGAARSRLSQTSPGFTWAPATAAQRVLASRRASGSPAPASRSTASPSASAIAKRRAIRSDTEPLLLTREAQGVDQIVEVAVQQLGEVVNGVVDAMIGDTVLRKVVRANLGRAIARAHLGPALAGTGRFLHGAHLVEQARAQDCERFDLVLELTLLVLALDHEIL